MKVREKSKNLFNKLAGKPVQNLTCDHDKSWKSTGKMHMKKSKKSNMKKSKPCLLMAFLLMPSSMYQNI